MNKIIGRFYFKLTDSKNLIGEFSNNGCDRNYTESADRILPNADDQKNLTASEFAGNFLTTWCDEENGKLEGVLANLKIEPKNGCNNIFSLEWQVVPRGKFWGEGMLCDGMLSGDYRNFQNP